MSSISEVGHNKNVANYEDLISRCIGLGTTYNPVLNAIKIVQMNAQKTAAIAALNNAITAFNVYKNSTNLREIAFKPLRKLGSRVIAALKASGASKQTIDDAIAINRKLQGKGKQTLADAGKNSESLKEKDEKAEVKEEGIATIPGPVEDKEAKRHSTSQQSFDSLIEHFTKLIDLVNGQPTYGPNEIELKVVTLNTTLAGIKASNTAVINAYTVYSNAKIARNTVLYAEGTGLVDVALKAKDYVRSVYGAGSPQAKQITKLKFRNFR